MNSYNQTQNDLKNNPTMQNQTKLNGIEEMIKESSVHNSAWSLSDPLAIENISIGDRSIYYPNQSTTLKIENN